VEHKIDDLRKRMIEAGLSSHDSALAVGLAAEYAMESYKEGFSRGFNEGVEWQTDRTKGKPH
jgi:hypothetical protein